MRTGRIIANRYRLEQPLASGGMGTVWIAEHTQLGIQVAVKFMDPELTSDPELRSRFEREAKSAAGLQSPHVIQIHDYGMEGDTPFIAMELLRGEDLEMRLARAGGKLDLERVAKLVTHTCKALRAAHDAGVVHRDLKPSNIFIVKDGDDELLKVLDFGIAKETGFASLGNTSKHNTSARELLGSPAYISPEQIRRARAVDRRTDLWSLAVIAYEACTGALPFDSEDTGDILAQILTDDAAPVTMLDDTLPEALDAFFDQALERDVDARFQTAQEFVAAFHVAIGAPATASSAGVPADTSGMHVPPPTSSQASRDGDEDALIQVEKVQAATIVMDDPNTNDGAMPAIISTEKSRTVAGRSVDIQPAPANQNRSLLWIAVSLLGVGVLAFALMRSGEPVDAAAPAAERTTATEGTASAPDAANGEPTTVPRAGAPPEQAASPAPLTTATELTTSPDGSASTAPLSVPATSSSSAVPPAPRPPLRARPKPKSKVLGF